MSTLFKISEFSHDVNWKTVITLSSIYTVVLFFCISFFNFLDWYLTVEGKSDQELKIFQDEIQLCIDKGGVPIRYRTDSDILKDCLFKEVK